MQAIQRVHPKQTVTLETLGFADAATRETGATVVAEVRRSSDGYYYNFTTDTFVVGQPTEGDRRLALSHVTNFDGLYSESWDLSEITNPVAEDTYTVNFLVTGGTAPAIDVGAGQLVIDRAMYAADYDGAIWVAKTGSNPGTPVVGIHGTRDAPVNNLADALTLAAAYGTRDIVLLRRSADGATDTFTFTGAVVGGYRFRGLGPAIGIDFNGQSVDGCDFENLVVTGAQAGIIYSANSTYTDCLISTCSVGGGRFRRCHLYGTMTLVAGGGGGLVFTDCDITPSSGLTPFVLDLAGQLYYMDVAGMRGEWEIRNSTSVVFAQSKIHLAGGQLTLAASNTVGTMDISGYGLLIDSSAGMTVDTTALLAVEKIDTGLTNQTNIEGKVDIIDTNVDALLGAGGSVTITLASGGFLVGRQSLGSTVRFLLDITQAGSGIISQSPTIAIQRLADGKWLQDSDNTWQTTTVENPMVETDNVNLPGRYHFDFDQSLDTLEGSVVYSVRKTNTGSFPTLQYEDVIFGPFAAANALNLCSVQGTVANVKGKPVPNTLVRATLVPLYTDSLGRSVRSDQPLTTYTNAQGDFDLPLVRGGTFRLEVPGIGYDRRVTIPDQATVLFTDL